MNQISECAFSKFINQEHYDFFAEMDSLIVAETPEKLGIVNEYTSFKRSLNDESIALSFVRKNSFSSSSTAATNKLDETISGMSNYIDSFSNHFDPNVREAGTRILLMWNTNKNVRSKQSKTRAGAIRKVLLEFETNYAADVRKTALGGWVAALNEAFTAYVGIDSSKQTEYKNKTNLRMETSRIKTDKAFNDICIKVNALAVVNGDESYLDFIGEVNQRIKTFTTNISIRKAKRKKKDTDTQTEETK